VLFSPTLIKLTLKDFFVGAVTSRLPTSAQSDQQRRSRGTNSAPFFRDQFRRAGYQSRFLLLGNRFPCQSNNHFLHFGFGAHTQTWLSSSV